MITSGVTLGYHRLAFFFKTGCLIGQELVGKAKVTT